MSILARFSDKALFPSFDDLPTALSAEPQPSKESDAAAREDGPGRWFLVGQITENMTITKPTLILRDRNSSAFALTFEGAVDLKGWRKGYTLIAENVRRTEAREEGKRGFVRVEKGNEGRVRCIPGPMDKVIVLGGELANGASREGGECRACGREGGKKCLGCGWVRFCGKVSCSLPVMMMMMMMTVLMGVGLPGQGVGSRAQDVLQGLQGAAGDGRGLPGGRADVKKISTQLHWK